MPRRCEMCENAYCEDDLPASYHMVRGVTAELQISKPEASRACGERRQWMVKGEGTGQGVARVGHQGTGASVVRWIYAGCPSILLLNVLPSALQTGSFATCTTQQARGVLTTFLPLPPPSLPCTGWRVRPVQVAGAAPPAAGVLHTLQRPVQVGAAWPCDLCVPTFRPRLEAGLTSSTEYDAACSAADRYWSRSSSCPSGS